MPKNYLVDWRSEHGTTAGVFGLRNDFDTSKDVPELEEELKRVYGLRIAIVDGIYETGTEV